MALLRKTAGASPRYSRQSLNAEQLNFEHQRRIGWNFRWGATRAISKIRRDDELALASDLHADETCVPTFYHLPAAQGEHERLCGTVDGRAVGQRADIMHPHALALFRRGPSSDLEIGPREPIWWHGGGSRRRCGLARRRGRPRTGGWWRGRGDA